VSLVTPGEQSTEAFGPTWDDPGAKVFVSSEAEGNWGRLDMMTDSLMMSSLAAIQSIAHSIPGVLSLLTIGGNDDKIFRFLIRTAIHPTTPLEKRIVAIGVVQVQGMQQFVQEVLRPGDEVFPSDNECVVDPIVQEYGSLGHILCTEPFQKENVKEEDESENEGMCYDSDLIRPLDC
jgi:hypothetical protein